MVDGVKIKYGDVAPNAKENFSILFSEKEDFVDVEQLKKYNLEFPNYSNPCEYGSVLLNSSAKPLEEFISISNIGYWSKNISNSKGKLSDYIILNLKANELYTSKGFTLTFDTYNNIFCNDLTITWYRKGTKITEKDFAPNSAFYFCDNEVDNFDEVDIYFRRINMPYNRLKIRSIDYGYGTIFLGNELKNVSVLQEISPISAELSINTVDFSLNSKSNFEYSFNKNQPVQVYFDDNIIATTLITSSKRLSKTCWEINSEDYIGKISKITFLGNVYKGEETDTAYNILTEIFVKCKVPYNIEDSLKNIKLKGHLPMCNCREAVQQICFVVGAVCDTSMSDKINIKTLSSVITQNIPLSRIRQGQKFETADRYTKLLLTSYTYLEYMASDDSNSVIAYSAEESGVGDSIFVKFSEPLHNLSIINGSILESNANYAIISANKHCELKGYTYQINENIHERNVNNINQNETEATVEVNGIGLINSQNCYDIMDRVFDNMSKTQTTYLKVYEGKRRATYGSHKYGTIKYGQFVYDKKVNLGDAITAETEYIGNVTGRIVYQRYNLNGRIIAKECELI